MDYTIRTIQLVVSKMIPYMEFCVMFVFIEKRLVLAICNMYDLCKARLIPIGVIQFKHCLYILSVCCHALHTSTRNLLSHDDFSIPVKVVPLVK